LEVSSGADDSLSLSRCDVGSQAATAEEGRAAVSIANKATTNPGPEAQTRAQALARQAVTILDPKANRFMEPLSKEEAL